MKIIAPMSLAKLLEKLNARLAASQYGTIVSLTHTTTTGAEVVINKFGTSTLSFTCDNDNDASCSLELKSKSVSFLHKKYIPDVLAWITDAVKTLGGETEA